MFRERGGLRGIIKYYINFINNFFRMQVFIKYIITNF